MTNDKKTTRAVSDGDICDYYTRHPDECCCHTYLGRDCCKSPIHGDLYRASCIEHGERFTTTFRAKDLKEAREMGREAAAGWGGECIGVRKVVPNLCVACGKECPERYWRAPPRPRALLLAGLLRRLSGHARRAGASVRPLRGRVSRRDLAAARAARRQVLLEGLLARLPRRAPAPAAPGGVIPSTSHSPRTP
jgi:hypothetical protein